MTLLNVSYRVTGATGELELSTYKVKYLVIAIQGDIFEWEFLLYKLKAFDVILGID